MTWMGRRLCSAFQGPGSSDETQLSQIRNHKRIKRWKHQFVCTLLRTGKRMSRMLIVVLLISASACAAFDQNTTKITVELVVTNDSDSPVQIMGIASVAGDTELFVSVRNISSRAVKAVKVSTATAAPEGCSSGGHEPIFATSNAGDDSLDARLEIAPSATV